MVRLNSSGSTSWFNIGEMFRWGQSFIKEEIKSTLPFKGDSIAYCDPDVGWGDGLDDSCSCWFEYSDDVSQGEKESIESSYHEGDIGWLLEGDHGWNEYHSAVHVHAPFKVSIFTSDWKLIQENIDLSLGP